MNTPTMTPVTKTEPTTFDVRSLKSIQLADGWHQVRNCKKIEFSVTSSPLEDGPYTTLEYENESGHKTYTPFKHILSFSDSPIK